MAVTIVPDMASEEFALWQTLLEERTGLWLPESRKVFLTTALSSHMKSKGISCYSELYSRLNANAVSVLDWASLVDSLTVHETCYYREYSSLRLVSNYCRNRVLENFQKEPNKSQHFEIWSVGCSTGEEVYSLAMEIDKVSIGLYESSGKKVYFGVTGVDISYPSLAVAREGVYAEKQLEFMPKTTKHFYFNQLEDGYYQVKDKIKQRTCFIQANALDLNEKISQEFDVIYCQNMIIYFREEVKRKVVDMLAKKLKPGGMLVLGHGEVISIDNPLLTRLDSKENLAYLRHNH